jgi:antitoxin component of RelBE/YafQ-DinJ toxin-antitoxin module
MTKNIGVHCTPEERQVLKEVLSREGLSLSEALKLYIYHVCFIEDLPFEVHKVFNPDPTPKKSDFMVVTVKKRFYDTFSEVAKKLNLTKAKILYLFIQYVSKHKKLPYLFRADCKQLNECVIISYRFGR